MNRLLVFLLAWILVGTSAAWANEFSVAFYYGDRPPLDELKAFDVVVVDPDQGLDPRAYRTATSELFAYISVGEVEPYRSFASEVPRDWIVGTNEAWESDIVDLARPGWATFLVRKVIGPLWERGYRGFFLDTLDSYQRVATAAGDRRRQEAGLIAIVRAIKTAYPQARLIFNRGFEVIPHVSDLVYAVAVESLFRGWDQETHRYTNISDEERQWLLKRLKAFKRDYGLPIIVIDYVPPEEREQARSLARNIEALGMIPWVSNPQLNQLGVGSVEVMPRKVLAVFDGGHDPDPAHSELHRYLDLPLNYLGYMPEHWNVEEPLPTYPLVGRYAGIVAWLPRDQASWSRTWQQWLVYQVRQGMRVALFDTLGFPIQPRFLEPLNLATAPAPRQMHDVTITKKDPRVGAEIAPIADRRSFVPLTVTQGHSLLRIGEPSSGRFEDAIALMDWGGFALRPYAVLHLPTDETRWIIDPISFLQDTLKLPPMPVPDTTTESGRRLLLVHVDGDGFPSRAELPGTPFAGEVLYREILVHYRIPTTVSVIEGEIASTGLYPEQAPELEAIAREIFALPHVEVASHSYSHPFLWREFVDKGSTQPGQYHLHVPNYVYGPQAFAREIKGSIDYIQTRLTPPGKKVKVFLWTGDCDPPSEAVGETYALGVGNMNGGDTIITRERQSLTAVAPLGIDKGGYFQVYAPNQNENLYTNQWRGPFYGYRDVIETFELTDRPRRLKPINIYYHTYSASKQASLAALHKVYEWAMQQATYPVSVSEYIRKVLDFQHMTIAKDRHAWRIRGAHHLRELRIPKTSGFPDLETSEGVIGFSDHERDRYVHLAGDHEAVLVLRPQRPRVPYLAAVNGRVSDWKRDRRTLHFRIAGTQRLEATIVNVHACRAESQSEVRTESAGDDRVELHTTLRSSAPVFVACRQ